MKIAITGSRGMLGTDLMRLFEREHEVLGLDLHNCDILDAAQLQSVIAPFAPNVIIHAAAYTNVDKAESDRDSAFALNETGTKHVAEAAKVCQAKLVYISTDYVFDGTKGTPYSEDDAPSPLGAYGWSKWRGEEQIRTVFADDPTAFLIVRIAWLYGKRGKNFVETILNLAQQQDTLRVVNDQFGSPTYTQDVARALQALIQCHGSGVVHATNSGQCTWHEFAETILQFAGITGVTVLPISSAELNRPAPRPAFSVLQHERFTQLTGQQLRHWKDGLRAYFEERSV
ncbi:DTDP-4-dehydrorhamnose reductase [Candidatus Moduliflexus flocculans]|uniref:dTDP-4-dehydrorhamnose reductase n=1 Tax=Candidatus Moduliflexus flocculans TaxID=1499966 RepID=A0A0S6VQT4_9BACT|nr:DTDP-4-dehydrorhamnose reductase [Candidatus Moduliflexus flocculans]